MEVWGRLRFVLDLQDTLLTPRVCARVAGVGQQWSLLTGAIERSKRRSPPMPDISQTVFALTSP